MTLIICWNFNLTILFMQSTKKEQRDSVHLVLHILHSRLMTNKKRDIIDTYKRGYNMFKN